MGRPYRLRSSSSLRIGLTLAALFSSISLAGCGPEAARRPGTVYARVERQRHAGDLPAASADGVRAFAAWERRPSAYWHWAFRLQYAETLLARGDVDTAARLLEPAPPPGIASRERLTARRMMDRGYAEFLRSHFTQSLDLLGQAYKSAKRSGLSDLVPMVQIYRAFAHVRLNQPAQAETDLRDAFAASVRARDPYLEASASGSMAFALINQYRYDEARQWTEHSLSLSQKGGFHAITAANLLNLGHANFRLGDLDTALRNFTESEEHLGRIGKKIDRQLSLANLADVQYAKGDYQGALETYKKALPMAEALHDDFWVAKWLVNMAAIYTEMGDAAAAIPLNDRALEIQSRRNDRVARLYPMLNAARIAALRGNFAGARRQYRDVLAQAPPGSDLEWDIQAGLAEICFAQDDETGARREVGRAVEAIDGNWSRLNDRSKLTFPTRVARFYSRYIDFLVDHHRGAEAFAFAESRRARLLAEKMGIRSDASAGFVPAAIVRPPGAVMLSYWLGPKRSYLWELAHGGIHTFPLPPEETIARLVREYAGAIEAARDPNLNVHPAARELYDLLVRPAGKPASGGSRVILAPDGILHNLNFATLATPHHRYWIEDATIEVVPSLALFGREQPAPRRPGALLLIGDPANARPPLPNAGREIDTLTGLYRNAVVYRGAAATPDAYTGSDLSQFSGIHFAAHATANAESPLDSAVLLSPGRHSQKLYARQVLASRLRADLVTISACDSAQARTFSGEGPVGFAWAFLIAGARQVVASLWGVADRTTADLMRSMYREIRAGAQPAAALRAAQLEFVHAPDFRSKPYYWAPFQIYTR